MNARSKRSSLVSVLLGPADADPAEVVIIDGARTTTRAQLGERAHAVADALARAGVGPGDRVASRLPTSATTIAAMAGTWLAGAVYVPVNPRAPEGEVAAQLEATGSFVLVTPATDDAGRPTESVVVTRLNGGTTAGAATDAADDVALVLTTSGTTGRPKPVELYGDRVLAGIDTVLGSLRAASSATSDGAGGAGRSSSGRRAPTGAPPAAAMPNLVPVSLALWAGIYNVLFAFRAGSPVVLLDPFDTTAFAAAVAEHHIRSTVLAPAMMTMLSDDRTIADLAPLRIVRSITAPLSPAEARRFHDRFGVTVLNSYGQTELGGEVIGWRAADAREFGTAKLGALGRPHAGVEIVVLDGDRPVEAGEEGELCVRSPYMMKGYLTDELGARLTAEGFLRTGDIGHVDADGFVWLSGRVSDLINRGGLKVFPGDVEEVLRRHPAVADVAVAGVPDRRLGEVPWAFVVAADAGGAGALADELIEHCRRELVAYKVPARVVLVDGLPRNEVGKVLRRELVAAVEPAAEQGAAS